jgi:O-acetyl-ADP-ribose deacetylase (regulator of RNase III)
MIQYIKGNLFTSNAKVIVNTVNTVGVMGKGIAADFKKYYPEMFDQYKKMCDSGKFEIGYLYLYKTPNKWVLNFPTKKHWRAKSTLEYIEIGLVKLVSEATKLQITDIAMPKLGCGNGGLEWETQVKPLVEKYLKKAPINVSIYDFDKDITPEYLKPKDIEEWLMSNPENLTFHLFFEDLKSIYKVDSLFSEKVTLSNKQYEINYHQKESVFEISRENIQIILSKDDIQTIFFTLKKLGKLCKKDLYSTLYIHGNVILDFFLQLPYIVKNEDKIILNYTKASADIEVLEFDD